MTEKRRQCSVLVLTGVLLFGLAVWNVLKPADAVSATHTEANGDVVTEYRVGNQLRVVQVQPLRGPVYYLYDKDGDGIVDKADDNPPQTYFKLFSW